MITKRNCSKFESRFYFFFLWSGKCWTGCYSRVLHLHGQSLLRKSIYSSLRMDYGDSTKQLCVQTKVNCWMHQGECLESTLVDVLLETTVCMSVECTVRVRLMKLNASV